MMKSSHTLHATPEVLLDVLQNLAHDPERPLRQGWAVVEGHKAVANLLRSGAMIGGIVSAGAAAITDQHIDIHLSVQELTALIGFDLRSPVIAIAPTADIDLAAVKFPALVVNGVNDAVNMGAIVRTAAALGVATVVRCSRSAHPYVRRAVRTSMGTCFLVKTAMADNLASWIALCRSEGRTVVALETVDGAPAVHNVDYADAIVVGNEGQGIDAAVLNACSSVATIPMSHENVSLNVAAAAAIGIDRLLLRR